VTWLYQQVRDLWNYVRSLPAQIAASANKLLASIASAAQGAYNSAVAWASARLEALGSALWAAWKQIDYAVTQARAWVDARVKELTTLISSIGRNIQAWALDQLDILHVWVSDIVKWLSGNFYAALEVVRARIDELLGAYFWPVWKWFGFWADRLSIFTNDALEMLHHFFSSLYRFLSKLVDDPVGVIAAILASFLLDFLGELLATAMGSVKAELGPERRFGKYSSRGIVGDGAPPPGAGGLGSPLSSLWIDNGNTFGPGHPGLDLQLEIGQEVYAMHDGVATVHDYDADGYGNWVTIAGGSWWTLYGHLQSAAIGDVEQVYQGQVVGYGDDTGNSTGPHLHLEVKYNGRYIDPATVLPVS